MRTLSRIKIIWIITCWLTCVQFHFWNCFMLRSLLLFYWVNIISCSEVSLEDLKTSLDKIQHLKIPEHESSTATLSDSTLQMQENFVTYKAQFFFIGDKPSSILLLAYEQNMSNHVLCHFWEFQDIFLTIELDKKWDNNKLKLAPLLKNWFF